MNVEIPIIGAFHINIEHKQVQGDGVVGGRLYKEERKEGEEDG